VSSSAGVLEGDGGADALFLGPAMKRKGQRSGGRRRLCGGGGGKKSKFTPSPLFIPQDRVVGIVEVLHYPDRSAISRHVAARSGAAVPVTEPLGHDGLQ
jgi:hypothetical protein